MARRTRFIKGPCIVKSRARSLGLDCPGVSSPYDAITDAPLLPSQLTRVAKRATLGIARTGTIGVHRSGDIFLAFSTANTWQLGADAPARMTMEALNDHS